MSKTLAVAGALLASSMLVLPTISHAQEVNAVAVSYADLNLAFTPAQLTLRNRISYAARTVCVIEDSKELALRSATNDCRSDAVERAMPAYHAAVAAARHPSVTVLGATSLIVSGH